MVFAPRADDNLYDEDDDDDDDDDDGGDDDDVGLRADDGQGDRDGDEDNTRANHHEAQGLEQESHSPVF